MRKLFLASEAKHPESMKKMDSFVGGLKGKSIAYIPTAANGEEEYGKWKTGETWKVINNSARIYFLVTGKNKSSVVNKILNRNDEYLKFPASYIKPTDGELTWFLDKEAASEFND